MPVNPNTLSEFDGKQVLLTLITDDGATELEGKIEAASAEGVAFKEKGKRDVDLVMPDQIEEIALAPIKPKSLAQKKLKEIEDKNVRQHLLDRHGYERSLVSKMTDEQAADEHNEIDHDDLGHRHIAEDDESDETEETPEEE